MKGPAAARNPKIDHAYLVLRLAGQHDEHAMSQLDHQDSALMRFVKATSLLEIPDDEIVGLVVPTYAGPVSLTAAKNGDHAVDRGMHTNLKATSLLTCNHA